MRTSFALQLGVAVVSCSGASSLFASEYIEGVNDDLPYEEGSAVTGQSEVAYRWTAQNRFYLEEIRWRLTGDSTEALTVRLRRDTGGEPGALLREVSFVTSGTGWHGAPFAPYPVEAGESFFVTIHSTDGYQDCNSIGGDFLTYYHKIDKIKEWYGPFTGAGNRMIQFWGERPTCTGDETLTLRCKNRPCGPRMKAVMKHGQPGATVTFTLDADDTVPVEINENGRATHTW